MIGVYLYDIFSASAGNKSSHPSKNGARNKPVINNAFICKLNNNVLIGVQCDSVVVIQGKRLQSIGFVTSILPYIFFTWWVNNDIEQQSIAKA